MAGLCKVYVADGSGDAHFLRGLLEVEGIPAVVRGDDMVPLQGGSLFKIETRPSVWVLSDESDQYARAVAIVEEYAEKKRTNDTTAGDPWRCRLCGETVEAQFTDCWNCGVARE
jgi:hypothetical protein